MSVGFDEVRRIAALARIGVAEERLPALARELSGILAHMAVLQRVETSAATDDAGITQTPWRADQGPSVPLLRPPESFAPEMRDGFFIVPRLATHGGRTAGDGRSEAGDATDAPDIAELA